MLIAQWGNWEVFETSQGFLLQFCNMNWGTHATLEAAYAVADESGF